MLDELELDDVVAGVEDAGAGVLLLLPEDDDPPPQPAATSASTTSATQGTPRNSFDVDFTDVPPS
jgi:hypothetical protein